jgi:hypothetical protein
VLDVLQVADQRNFITDFSERLSVFKLARNHVLQGIRFKLYKPVVRMDLFRLELLLVLEDNPLLVRQGEDTPG